MKDGGNYNPNPMDNPKDHSTFGIPNYVINQNQPDTSPEAMVKNLASQTPQYQAVQKNNETINQNFNAQQQHQQQMAQQQAASAKKSQDQQQQMNQGSFNQQNGLEEAMRNAFQMRRRNNPNGY